MAPASTDVFVIGGGPAGLAAAIAARLRGMDVTLADSAAPPIDKACGEGIMPDGIAAARSLGLNLDSVPGRRFRGIRFCDAGTAVQAAFPNGVGVGMRRIELHARLVERAADSGVRLLWGSHVAGVSEEGVRIDSGLVRARWIVGADGGESRVRRWAGLGTCRGVSRRYGFRRHYRAAAFGDYMELHWGDACQLYITPVAQDEVCVALISRDPYLRLDRALPRFPEAAARLAGAQPLDPERGGVTTTRRLKVVARGNVALAGDASGSVDAITGEGLGLVFQQAVALAEALAANNLSHYCREHRRIGRRPEFMSGLMLLLDDRRRFRARLVRAMSADPRLFAGLLAMHVGAAPVARFAGLSLSLGWRMLAV